MEYKIRELTPESMRCSYVIVCPAIYEITPTEMQCGTFACPGVYNDPEELKYLIIGKIANAKEFGLEAKIGEGECLIEVPKNLIDDKGK